MTVQDQNGMPARIGKLSVLPVLLWLGGPEGACRRRQRGCGLEGRALACGWRACRSLCGKPQREHGGYRLAIAAMEEEHDAKAFAVAMRAAGAPANVIDKLEFCAYQFGLHRQSLARCCRHFHGWRPPPFWGKPFASASKPCCPRRWRVGPILQVAYAHVGATLQSGKQRRAFWENFVDQVFASPAEPEQIAEEGLATYASKEALQPARGSVTLVGAGPGGPELLTLKAMRSCNPLMSSCLTILFRQNCWKWRGARPSTCLSVSAAVAKAASRKISTP